MHALTGLTTCKSNPSKITIGQLTSDYIWVWDIRYRYVVSIAIGEGVT